MVLGLMSLSAFAATTYEQSDTYVPGASYYSDAEGNMPVEGINSQEALDAFYDHEVFILITRLKHRIRPQNLKIRPQQLQLLVM